MSIACPTCGFQNREGARYCTRCGQPNKQELESEWIRDEQTRRALVRAANRLIQAWAVFLLGFFILLGGEAFISTAISGTNPDEGFLWSTLLVSLSIGFFLLSGILKLVAFQTMSTTEPELVGPTRSMSRGVVGLALLAITPWLSLAYVQFHLWNSFAWGWVFEASIVLALVGAVLALIGATGAYRGRWYLASRYDIPELRAWISYLFPTRLLSGYISLRRAFSSQTYADPLAREFL